MLISTRFHSANTPCFESFTNKDNTSPDAKQIIRRIDLTANQVTSPQSQGSEDDQTLMIQIQHSSEEMEISES